MELNELFLVLLGVLVVLYLLWYFLLADADLTLSVVERFGRPVSDYQRKVIWVTGASSGLGEAMAYELASVGAKLVLTARNAKSLEQVKHKCLEISQGKLSDQDIFVLPFDITEKKVNKGKVDDVLNHFGKIDVLINNVGRSQLGGFHENDDDIDELLFNVNVFGCIRLTRLVLKHFLNQGSGQFVILSTATAKCPAPGCSIYCATKCALHGYFESLRMEHCNNNIHVTMVCPGLFQSSMMRNTIGTKKDEIFNNINVGGKEMDVNRCAHLTLVAAANKLYEAWIGYQLSIFMIFSAQYMPDVYRSIFMSKVCTKERIEKIIVDHQFPTDLPIWKPLR